MRYLILAAALVANTANAADCYALAQQYANEPYKMTIGQLDALRLCVVEQMELMIKASKERK